MDVVFNVATSIMVMQQGRTIVQGPPEEVRRNVTVQEAYLGRRALSATCSTSKAFTPTTG